MVLSRKKRQLLKAELNNNVTTPQIEKKEDVTGKKRKRGVQKKIQGKMGIQLEGKLEPFLPENGEVKVKKVASLNNNDGNQTKKMKISEEGGGKEVGCVLNKEEKVVSLNNNSNNNSESKKKKKKKKKKVKKKKTKVEEVVQEKPQSEVEIDGVLEQEKPQSVVGNAGISQQIVQATSKGNAGDARKVYVGGMPYYSTEDDIRSYFEYCGAITDIDCMTFPETGKFRGIAMITFETEDAAKSALELDGSDMEGLYLKIEPYKTTRPAKTSSFSPPVIEGYYRIYAGNLSWDITEADLRKLFADCNITSIRFGEDKETGNFKGYAHVDFADDASLNKALRLDQKFVCGRPVKISRAVPKKGAVRNGVAPSTEVKPANSQEVNSVVAPENNSVLNPVVTPENKTAANSAVTPENDSAVNSVVPPPENKSGVSASKLKRRTCYDCGERGHVSSDCPKNQKS